MPKVIATSDLHGELPEIEPCDILILAGDLCPDHPAGKAERYLLPDNGASFQLDFLAGPFRNWLASVPAKYIVGIAGNHDFVFERMRTAARELFLPWIYLEDSGTMIEGLQIWGTPWVPGLERWAFSASEMALEYRTQSIPPKMDILITHGPPWAYLDFTAPKYGSCHVGDKSLSDALPRLKPKVMVCGHIHEQYGKTQIPGGGTLYNVCFNDESYLPDNKPVILTEFLDG